jgi:F0F1-type ATP synthase delta subunit
MRSDEFKLPTTVVSQGDINRVARELDALTDFFISAAARQAGTAVKPPRITYLLEQLARDNEYNLLEEVHRVDLKANLGQVLRAAPVLHISFAAEPTPRIIDAIISWLRQNIHPHTLLQVGLQPSIAAGCVLRTPNKLFDMSLRANLDNQENYLVQLIQGAVGGKR